MRLILPRSGNREDLMNRMKRLLLNPIAFGIIFGGIPIATVLSCLGGSVVSPELFGYMARLTPVAIIITAVGALVTATRHGRKVLLRAALLVGIFACVPLPACACLGLEWRFGYSLSNPANSVFLIGMLLAWAIAVAATGWVLAMAVDLLCRRFYKTAR